MALIRTCDKCGEPIDTEGPISDRSWVEAGVNLDEGLRDGGTRKDYHRSCAVSVTLAEVWKRPGLVDL